MSGALHLIPVGLGEAAPERWLPAEVRALAGRLDTYIAENAKTARAFLKLVGTERPLQEITIHTLSDKADDGQIQSWLQSARQGGEIGLVSEAGCPPSPTPAPRSWPPPTAWASRCDPGSALLHPAGTDGQRPGRAALRLPRLCAGGRGRASQAAARLGAAFRPPRPDPAADRNPYRNAAMYATLLASLKGDTRLCVARSSPPAMNGWPPTPSPSGKTARPSARQAAHPVPVPGPLTMLRLSLILAAAAAWRAAPRAAPPAWTWTPR